MSIDDPRTVARLMDAMGEHLPIPVSATTELAQTLQQGGLNFKAGRSLSIERVFYGGDEGGISCYIAPTPGVKEVVLCSLTHLRIERGHPLYREIRAYQRERNRRIAASHLQDLSRDP